MQEKFSILHIAHRNKLEAVLTIKLHGRFGCLVRCMLLVIKIAAVDPPIQLMQVSMYDHLAVRDDRFCDSVQSGLSGVSQDSCKATPGNRLAWYRFASGQGAMYGSTTG